MIKPPSLVDTYHLVFTGDPGLDVPPQPKRADSEDFEAWIARAKTFYEGDEWQAWLTKLRIARQAGTPEAWQAVTKSGDRLTLFLMRQVEDWRPIKSWIETKHPGVDVASAVCFRAAIAGIVNGPEIKIEQSTDEATGVRMATKSVVVALDRIHPDIVTELGAQVYSRITSPDPLS